eukprot:Hpha_TRINITY_DN15467_c1_g7::TRINITY_DN15467_c1_g7_i1::g.173575::m.173575
MMQAGAPARAAACAAQLRCRLTELEAAVSDGCAAPDQLLALALCASAGAPVALAAAAESSWRDGVRGEANKSPFAAERAAEALGVDPLGSALVAPPRPEWNHGKLRLEQGRLHARALVSEGVRAARRGDLGRAVGLYDEALRHDQNNADAYVARGAAAANEGRHAEALVDLERALQAEPRHPNAVRYREALLQKLRDKDERRTERDRDQRKQTTPAAAVAADGGRRGARN